jgi:alcohol dehydrogenase
VSGLATSASAAADDPIHLGWPDAGGPFVAVIDPWTAAQAAARAFLDVAQATYTLPGRPTIGAAHEISRLVETTRVARVVSIGAGLVIDTAKLVVFELRGRAVDGRPLDHVAVPCGPEPYRAVTPFAMFEGPAGTREAAWEQWLPASEVAVVPELLDALDGRVIELFSGDSLIHALESMLTTLSTAESERHALAAADAFARRARGVGGGPSRADLVVASIEAARAFDVTKLGLAHALSRPLGIRAATSHDAHNLMVGPAAIRFWSDAVIARTAISRVDGTEATADAWADIVDGYRIRAGLPAPFEELGLTWDDAQFAIEMAPRSSGIPNLPEKLVPGALERIMRAGFRDAPPTDG